MSLILTLSVASTVRRLLLCFSVFLQFFLTRFQGVGSERVTAVQFVVLTLTPQPCLTSDLLLSNPLMEGSSRFGPAPPGWVGLMEVLKDPGSSAILLLLQPNDAFPQLCWWLVLNLQIHLQGPQGPTLGPVLLLPHPSSRHLPSCPMRPNQSNGIIMFGWTHLCGVTQDHKLGPG